MVGPCVAPITCRSSSRLSSAHRASRSRLSASMTSVWILAPIAKPRIGPATRDFATGNSPWTGRVISCWAWSLGRMVREHPLAVALAPLRHRIDGGARDVVVEVVAGLLRVGGGRHVVGLPLTPLVARGAGG